MAFYDTDDRPRLVAALHDLADFLESRSDVPAPRSINVMVCAVRDTDDAMREAIDQIASLIGAEIDPEKRPYDHYETGLSFGPVQYTALAVLAGARARYDADRSYAGAVVPDAPEEA